MHICKVCHNSEQNKTFVAREMMFGIRDEFDYFECSNCGCVQIAEVPADLAKYYTEEYFVGTEKTTEVPPPLKLGEPVHQWLELAGLNLDSKILDVGSGRGKLLVDLNKVGYSNLTGVDPFIDKDLSPKPGIKILNQDLKQVKGIYDFIMLHHSFEHMSDPLDTLKDLFKLLLPNHLLLIRIPVASYAWKQYEVDWVQLDPPRHLFLFTEKSMQILAEEAGFSIEKVVYDSNGFQFYGSEFYKRDLPLASSFGALFNDLGNYLFSMEELQEFEDKAVALNEKGEGDQACFYLRKKLSTNPIKRVYNFFLNLFKS